MQPADVGGMRRSLAARTRFFDEQVLAAIRAGIAQVVIAGAGYDDRALRFRSPGVRFFEIDHPATQYDKASRLRGMNASRGELTLAAADFRTDDVASVLSACGHDASRSSLFVCEGLLVYLDLAAGIRLLQRPAGPGGAGQHAGGQPGRPPSGRAIGAGGRGRQRPAADRRR